MKTLSGTNPQSTLPPHLGEGRGGASAEHAPSPFGGGQGWGFRGQGWGFRLAFRNLRRNGVYSAINVGGLAVSIVATVLILLWVYDEWNYDRVYKDVDRIYQVIDHSMENGREDFSGYHPVPLARTVQASIPGVEKACAYSYDWTLAYLAHGDKKCFGKFLDFAIADTTFFSMFDMQFTEGNAQTAFLTPTSMILCENWARQLFGNDGAVGKLLKTNTGKEFQVTAVVKPKDNSTFNFKALVSFEQSSRTKAWGQWTSLCFVKLQPGVDAASIGTLLSEVHQKNNSNYRADFPNLLQPISKAHLYAPDGSETGMKNVRMFSLIALALLVIACINYVNLATARMNKRDKEITVRKILGAKKGRIFGQIMGESLLLFLVSLVLAQLLLFLAMPMFETLTGKHFSFGVTGTFIVSLSFVILLVVTLLAGVYPAVRFSSFRLSGLSHTQPHTGSPFTLRKVLVVVQFSCSAALILFTIALGMQQHFMQTKHPGYQRENIFTIDVMANKNANRFFEAFKRELEQQTEIAGVTASEQNIMDVGNFTGLKWNGMPDGLNFSTAYMGVSRDFLQQMNITLVEGEGFTGSPADSVTFLLNETAVKQMGLDNPLNTTVSISWLRSGKVAGVVKDFHFRHMSESIGPMVMFIPSSYWTLYVKAAAGKTGEALAVTERIWKKYDQEFPFDYTFMDETFAHIYENDTRSSHLFNAFAIIAIFVSCLGLFGLITFVAENKTREIGIRKVLGASITGIVEMLTKEFLILVGIAMLIAFPLAYYFLDKMLQGYAYHISISWWMFALAGVITLALTLLTVGFKAMKAATTNPVKAIKAE